MSRLARARAVVRVAALIVAALVSTGGAGAEGPAVHPHADVHNWGRWGADDQRGAANLITPERLVAAARLITSGKSFSLAIPIASDGPVFPGRSAPHHTMAVSGADYAAGASGPFMLGAMKFADDYIYMPLQGSTQWDGLSHGWYGDTLHNGVPEAAIRGAPMGGGATRLGIEHVRDSLIGRGVLVDVLRHKGGALPPGYGITRADLEGALAAQGSAVEAGDIVLIRTGWVPAYYELEQPAERAAFLSAPQLGIAPDVIPWIRQHDIAAIAADNMALEAFPNPVDPVHTAGLHGNLLRDMGVFMGEIWWLEELAADCAADGRYSFFLAAQPLHIPGAVGSPLNPVAIK